jgi:hypothetical protein
VEREPRRGQKQRAWGLVFPHKVKLCFYTFVLYSLTRDGSRIELYADIDGIKKNNTFAKLPLDPLTVIV